MIAYAFDVLGLHRVELEYYSFNPRAGRAYAKVGFVEEGRRRHALLYDGEWIDAITMAIAVHRPALKHRKPVAR